MFFQFIKYGIGSIFTYSFLFFGVYFLTSIIGVSANISYLIILTITYLLNYLVAAKFIFLKEFTRNNIVLFGFYVFVFWVLNNLFFNIFFKFTNIHYLFITAINVAIFALFRFLTLRHIFKY